MINPFSPKNKNVNFICNGCKIKKLFQTNYCHDDQKNCPHYNALKEIETLRERLQENYNLLYEVKNKIDLFFKNK